MSKPGEYDILQWDTEHPVVAPDIGSDGRELLFHGFERHDEVRTAYELGKIALNHTTVWASHE
jgi:hypothetical protein